MEENFKYNMLSEKEFDGLIVQYPESMIVYVASDGKQFTSAELCEIYDRPIRRQKYYEFLLTRRNWFQRFFNIKPSMKFYDSIRV